MILFLITMVLVISKGVLLFRSGLTRELYKGFLDSYQLNRSEFKSPPFVYVDPQIGSVKFLTNLMKSDGDGAEISAVSIASCGNLEVLSTES
jgi:hypothetical protein